MGIDFHMRYIDKFLSVDGGKVVEVDMDLKDFTS